MISCRLKVVWIIKTIIRMSRQYISLTILKTEVQVITVTIIVHTVTTRSSCISILSMTITLAVLIIISSLHLIHLITSEIMRIILYTGSTGLEAAFFLRHIIILVGLRIMKIAITLLKMNTKTGLI